MRALVEGCAARGKQIHLGGPLFADALGPSGTYEGTYIGMMDHNFRIITEGLGGTVTDKRFAP
jgi:manganese/zinc/iron transport system substrate-binding protein